jgi:hypothetical protein
MNKHLPLTLLLLFILFTGAPQLHAQSGPNDYLSGIMTGEQQITEDFLSYISALTHGKSARKIEKRRTQLLTDVSQAKTRITHAPPFTDGDTTVRAAALNYYNIDYNLLKEDYAKIVDMEEISEESYDNMEAYLNAQNAADQKLQDAFKKYNDAIKVFADKHDIKIVDDNSKMAQKAEIVHKVNDYYHQVYLVFFKSYKQELYLSKAVEKKDLNGIEQNKNTLLKNITEGYEKLGKLPPYDSDADLANACRAALQFYQKEAKTSVPVVSDFLLKSDNFEKLKKSMDSGQHTKEQVDEYNKAVKDINAAVGNYNRINKEDNDTRTKITDGWNNNTQGFLAKHTPRYNK